jgi:hypothetical protein
MYRSHTDIGVPSREVLVLLVLDSHLVKLLILLLVRLGSATADNQLEVLEVPVGGSSADARKVGRRDLVRLGSSRSWRLRLELSKVDDLDALALDQAVEVRLDVAALQEDSGRRGGKVHGVLGGRGSESRVEEKVQGGRDWSGEGKSRYVVL